MNFQLFDIDIKIHWTWWVVAVPIVLLDLFSLNFYGALFSAWVLSWMVILIIGHELSHALTARKYGHKTESIYLHLLGGAALMRIGKTSPTEDAWIAAAGPLFNFIAVGLLAPFYLITDWMTYPIIISLFMGLFNLIPAYPMDGGRIVRALIKMNGITDYNSIKITQVMSVGFAGLFVIGGIILLNPFLFLVGLLVWLSVLMERQGIRI